MTNIQEIVKKINGYNIHSNGYCIEDGNEYTFAIIDPGVASILLNTNNSLLPDIYSAFEINEKEAIVRMPRIYTCHELISNYNDETFRNLFKEYLSNDKVDSNIISRCVSLYKMLEDNNIIVPNIDDLTINSFGLVHNDKIFFKDLSHCYATYKNDLLKVPEKYHQQQFESDLFYVPDIDADDVLEKIKKINNPYNISISLSYYGDEGDLFLESFERPKNAPKGSGLQYLKHITKLLDSHGYSLYCEASEESNKNNKLTNLYFNAGFAINPEGPVDEGSETNIIPLKRPYVFENRVVPLLLDLERTPSIKPEASIFDRN